MVGGPLFSGCWKSGLGLPTGTEEPVKPVTLAWEFKVGEVKRRCEEDI